MKHTILAAALLVAACAHQRPIPPQIIPVAAHCVHGQLPAEPAHVQDRLTGDEGVDIGIISGSALELRVWGEVLFRLLESCQSDGSTPVLSPATAPTTTETPAPAPHNR